jgi:hypothetical protein
MKVLMKLFCGAKISSLDEKRKLFYRTFTTIIRFQVLTTSKMDHERYLFKTNRQGLFLFIQIIG